MQELDIKECVFVPVSYNIATEKNYINCACGWREEYNPHDRGMFPYRVWEDHKLIRMQSLENPHRYGGIRSVNGLDRVFCSCGWKKRVKYNKDPRNVWQGHFGQATSPNSRGKPNKRNRFWTSPYEHSGSNSWNGNRRQYSWSSRTTPAQINKVADEVLGGTYVSLECMLSN